MSGDECGSPVVFNLGCENQFAFSNLETDSVLFDIDADGALERTAWTASDNEEMAFLVLDRNLNGHIDDGSELFGNVTDQPESTDPHGFAALAVFDQYARGGNEDGVITSADAVFADLRLWRDMDHDGTSHPSELSSLSEENLAGIDLGVFESRRRDRYGNLLRWRSRYYDRDGQHRNAVDVYFRIESD